MQTMTVPFLAAKESAWSNVYAPHLETAGLDTENMPWGIPTQGLNTPTTITRHKRTKSAVGLKMEMGLLLLVEEGGETVNGSEKGLWRLLWCRNIDIVPLEEEERVKMEEEMECWGCCGEGKRLKL